MLEITLDAAQGPDAANNAVLCGRVLFMYISHDSTYLLMLVFCAQWDCVACACLLPKSLVYTTALLPMPSHALSMYNIRSVATKFSSEPNLTRILKDPQEHEQQQH